jgi:hypothetical protein
VACFVGVLLAHNILEELERGVVLHAGVVEVNLTKSEKERSK